MQFFRNSGHFILIPLMVIASVGFSLEVHYCGQEVQNFGFFGAEECETASLSISPEEFAALPPCHQAKLKEENKKCVENQHKKDGYNSNSCCHNESYNFSVDIAGENSAADVEPINQSFLIPITKEIFALSAIAYVHSESVLFYHPPIYTYNRCVKFQVFRI